MDLNQVTLNSKDVIKAAEFYKTLGFKLIVDSIPRYARFECPNGDSTLSLHAAAETPVNTAVVLYFECADVDAEHGRLAALGVEFDTEPVNQDWLWREASFRDPDDNRLIIFTAGVNRKNPPWRIGI